MSAADERNEIDEEALLAEDAADLGLAFEQLPRRAWHEVDLPEGRIRAIQWGDGDPALTLLHGGGLNALTWNSMLLALGRPALALDLPGHGDSDWRADADYTPEQLAPSVAEAIGILSPGARMLVGHSLGGLTAIAVADLRPDLVSRLVLIDVTPGIRVGGGNQVRDFLAGPESFASRDEVVERARSFGFGRSDSAVRRGVARNTRVREDGRIVWKHHLAQLPPGVNPFTDFTPLWPRLQRVDAPVTAVVGRRGFLRKNQLEEFRTMLPGAEIVELEAGHNVHEDDPIALAGVLADLLDR